MKKKVLFFVAVVAISVIGLISYSNATASPDCPNGCKPDGKGCQCKGWHPTLLEAKSSPSLEV